jgi:hypothetical protein
VGTSSIAVSAARLPNRESNKATRIRNHNSIMRYNVLNTVYLQLSLLAFLGFCLLLWLSSSSFWSPVGCRVNLVSHQFNMSRRGYSILVASKVSFKLCWLRQNFTRGTKFANVFHGNRILLHLGLKSTINQMKTLIKPKRNHSYPSLHNIPQN